MPAQMDHTVTRPHVSPVVRQGGPGSVVLPMPLLLPSYGGACLDSLAPSLLASPGARPDWLPGPLRHAEQVVLLLLDGLGWLQLQARAHLAPTISGLEGARSVR